MQLQRLQFRFLDADDIAAYGDGWWLWDEPAVARLRGRELIDLEELVDQPVIKILRGLREEKTLATMQAMWIALHRGGHSVAWADFEPVVNDTDWQAVSDEAPLDSGEDPVPDSGSSTAPALSMESPSS